MEPTDLRNLEKSVSLNLNVRGLKKSATLAVNEMSNSLIGQGRTVYKLGLGQSPFPVPGCVVEALRINAYQKDYLEAQGLRVLREAIAQFHQKNDGVNISPDLVLVGPGSKELMFLLQVAFYGDLVIPTPCWVSYAPQARIVGHQVTFFSTNYNERWHLTSKGLEDICTSDPTRPRIIVLNYPGNPDGLSYDIEELQKIADVARKYNLIILSDEIYGKIHHQGKHVSIARFYPEGTIISSGLSKWCGAGGWRLGTFSFPTDLRRILESMTSLASETYTSTSAPIQYAAVRAFQGGEEIEIYLAHVRRILSALGQWCASRLKETGVKVWEPEGGFYLFPDFSPMADRLARQGIFTAKDLCEKALQEVGVAFLPGVEFSRPENELTARLAYVDFDGAVALTASRTIPLQESLDEEFLRTYCFKTVQAFDILSDWLTSIT